MAEITQAGFVSTTQNEYFEQLKNLLLSIDPAWNLDPSTPDALKIAMDAEIFGNLDEVLQAAYNSKDPAKAAGIELDTICALTGTQRSLGTPSTIELTLSGVAGTLITGGSIVDSGINTTQWATNNDVTIDAGGSAQVVATALTNGALDVDVGAINRIVTTVGGWQKVTNSTTATLGTDAQKDSSLRIERALSVGKSGNNQIDSMIGELFSVSGVTNVVIPENFTGATDSNGLPPHSIAPIVNGGTDQAVAKAIFIKKNPGCALYAAGTAVTVPNVYNLYKSNSATITFSRPIYVDVVLSVTIVNDGTLPSNAAELITDNILSYANGSAIPASAGFNQRGYDIGQDVPVNQLATPINQIIGGYGYSYIDSLEITGVTTPVLTIAFNQMARFLASNVTVNIV